MDGFSKLLALTHAAESCNGAARQFVEQYSRVPEWSHFQNGTLCQPTADSQASQHLGYARSDVDSLRDYIRNWDAAYDGLGYINEAIASNPAWPILNVNGRTYNTGHEAARGFAEWIVAIYGSSEGFGDREIIDDIARRLEEVFPLQDFDGYVQRENALASPLAPLDPEVGGTDAQASALDGAEYIGPLSPAEWRKRFGGMSETTFKRERKKMRVDRISTKSLRIHRDDVARYEKS